ncbi:MAG: LPS export ABC transporter periplasmic protein LptC [candidate division WOR-3 bacterium]|nr:LPS export ABC transporter periplasmic protein LptC [candidate division WOR-3 bacterium]MCX7757316.1 LPS export ABC transporter periplasmic protein LptC [candidate division WOR-3 bacterium]MDW7987150.1 LPS export ABC transporter periplasmic protein LptC [candidate division WOR-3 bacterium]
MKKLIITCYLIGFVIVFLITCQKESRIQSPTRELPSQIIRNFKFYESTSGKILYEVSAESAYIYEQTRRICAFGVEVLFYNKDGTITNLSAQMGRVNTDNSNLVAQGNVIVRTADSTYLYTDSLIWDNARQIIITDAAVKIISAKGTLEGNGLISDAELQRIEIKTEVRGKASYEFK